jgi:hypothetical protein
MLHATAEEIAVWQDRMVNGPYKTIGDVSTNSPGDWDRILSNANAFIVPGASDDQRYAGQTAASCYTLSGSGTGPGHSYGELLRDAGFVYLLTGTTSYRDAVRTELLAQAGVAGTDFSDGVRWCTTAPDDSDNIYSIAMWLTRLLYGYDYIRSSLSGGDQTTLDTWFENAGIYLESIIDLLVQDAYPDRNTDNYTTPTDAGVGVAARVLYFGGPSGDFWTEHWNNRSSNLVRAFTLIGILTDNATLKNQGKRWFTEWLKYAVFSDGTPQEFYRWEADYPTLGWSYASMVVGPMVTIADAFARAGDTSLYDLSTSTGYNGTAGGTKTLQAAVTAHLEYVNYTRLRYGTATFGGNPDYRIGIVDHHSPSFENRVEDTNNVPANMFFQDATLKTYYMRTASGAPAYAESPSGSGWPIWGGEWGTLPGVLFMFGQMEDNPDNPFLEGGEPEAPSPQGGGRGPQKRVVYV